jgi:hypothetical protein
MPGFTRRQTAERNDLIQKTIVRALLGWLGMWGCVVVSVITWALLAPVGRGRQNVPTVALLLMVLGAAMRRAFGWQVVDFVLSFGLALVTILLSVSFFSGYRGRELLDPSNLEWLGFLGGVVGIAWFGGFAVGTIWVRRIHARESNHAV